MFDRIKRTAAVMLVASACLAGVPALGQISIDMGQMNSDLSQAESLYDQQRYADALAIYSRLGSDGHVHAAYVTGLMHHRGRGTPANGAQAAYWYYRAARAGHPAAACNLGLILIEGMEGLQPNDVEGMAWLERSAILGNVPGQLAYGAGLINNSQKPEDTIEGAAWMLIAAEAGNEIAQQNLQTLKVDADQQKHAVARAQALRTLMASEQQRLGGPSTVQIGDSEVSDDDYPDRAGRYDAGNAVVVLRHGPRGAGQLYLGEVRKGGSRYPLRGTHANGRITGEYKVGPNQWQSFTLTFGNATTLTIDGQDHPVRTVNQPG